MGIETGDKEITLTLWACVQMRRLLSGALLTPAINYCRGDFLG